MLTYKSAGVDIESGVELVQRLKKICPGIGGFGGLYPLGDNFLVASTDGVGTKLKLAFSQNCHHTIGIDLVAMCVNDIITTGARPLFFLDYFATSKLDVDQAEQVLTGVAKGCQESNCLLLGGETAEMPGFYRPGEYDISGFAVGIVAKKAVIDGASITSGDLVVGILSNGLHSNGFSLVRKILENSPLPPFNLLEPTRIYVKEIQENQTRFNIKGIAHITGGGLLENIPRILPEGLGVRIEKGTWKVPEVFTWLKTKGHIVEDEMYRTFNMGIGMVLILSAEEARQLCQAHHDYPIIGKVVEGKGVVLK